MPPAGSGTTALIGVGVILLLSLLFKAGLARAFLKAVRGGRVGIGALVSGGRFYGDFLLGAILLGIIVALGSVLILPGPFFALAFILMFFFIVDGNAGVLRPMGRSWTTVMANFGPFLILTLLLLGAVAALFATFGTVLAVWESALGTSFYVLHFDPANFLWVIGAEAFLMSPFAGCCFAALYDRLTQKSAEAIQPTEGSVSAS